MSEKIPRLPKRDYDLPEGETREASRRLFLRAVQRQQPLVLWSLARAPFDAYRGRGDLSLADALAAWQDRWRLTYDWCRQSAQQTLHLWQLLEETWDYDRDPVGPHPIGRWWNETCTVDFDEAEPFAITLPGWHPSSGVFVPDERDPLGGDWRGARLQDAKRELLRLAERAIDAYLDSQEAAARAAGYVRVKARRAPGYRHFDWLALHLVNRKSLYQIAEWERSQSDPSATGGNVTTIAAGIHSAAEAIGIEPPAN